MIILIVTYWSLNSLRVLNRVKKLRGRGCPSLMFLLISHLPCPLKMGTQVFTKLSHMDAPVGEISTLNPFIPYPMAIKEMK